MVAVLVFHSRADLDWATALAGELGEHAPVRLQLTQTPPRATLGPSVVRVALWSDDAATEGTGSTFAKLLNAEPAHSILVRRGGCAPPAGIDPAALGDSLCVDSAHDGSAALKVSIPRVGAVVAEIVKSVRERNESRRERRLRLADNLLLAAAIASVVGLGAWQDWGGVRSAILATGNTSAAEAE